MDWYEQEVQALEQRIVQDPPAPHAVIFYGSSSIRLWNSLERDFPDVPVVNLGFGGSTLEACSWFYWRLVRPVSPRALVLYAGDNDIGDGKSASAVVDQLAFLLAQVDRSFPEIPVTVLSIKPSPARWSLVARIEEANRAMKGRVLQRKRGVWVNVFEAMIEQGRPRAELFAEDGLHLSEAGYALWRRVLAEHRPAAF